jgi:hypothetical protein
MGSGRGKTRRAQKTVWIPTPDVKEEELFEKWAEHVRDSGLENTNYFKYYLGDNYSVNNSTTWTIPNIEKAFNELFKDAVAVGIIELPQSYAAEDFLIKIQGTNYPHAKHPTSAGYEVEIYLKEQPECASEMGEMGGAWGLSSFQRDQTMGGGATYLTIQKIAEALSTLVQYLADNNALRPQPPPAPFWEKN